MGSPRNVKKEYNFKQVISPDTRQGHGYGTLNQKMVPRPISADGFPYDLEVLNKDEEDEEGYFKDKEINLKKRFSNKVGQGYEPSKPLYVSRAKDPFHYFDHNAVGFTESNILDSYIEQILEVNAWSTAGNVVRLKSRSSSSDGATTQWGTKVAGGTQFGWISAYPFPQKEKQYEPVFSLKDLLTKNEKHFDRGRGKIDLSLPNETDEEKEWKKLYGEKENKKKLDFF